MNIQERYKEVEKIMKTKPVHPIALGSSGIKLVPVRAGIFQLSLDFREVHLWCCGSSSWEDFLEIAAKIRHRDGQYCTAQIDGRTLPQGFYWGYAKEVLLPAPRKRS